MSTKLRVSGGTFVHASFGETSFGSAAECLTGIEPPSENAVDVKIIPGGRGTAAGPWAEPTAETASTAVIAQSPSGSTTAAVFRHLMSIMETSFERRPREFWW
jgi:hypothetical protein